jgi:hypothetical protein
MNVEIPTEETQFLFLEHLNQIFFAVFWQFGKILWSVTNFIVEDQPLLSTQRGVELVWGQTNGQGDQSN